MKTTKVWDGTDPGGTPGRVFTASIPQETIIPEGKVLTHLTMGIKGAVSTAAVAVEAFAGVLSEYVVKVGSENRIILNAQDLCALMAAYYGQMPLIGENTDNTGNDFIGGIKIPVYAATDVNKPFTHQATRTAVTNIGTETLAVSANWSDTDMGRKPVHAVKVPYTTSAATGYDTPAFRIAPVGRLRYLIIKQANGFDDGNIDVSVQRVRLLANGQLYSQYNVLADFTPVIDVDVVTPRPIADLLRLYTVLDLGPDGVDAKGQELNIQLDNEDASDAVSIIPVLEIV